MKPMRMDSGRLMASVARLTLLGLIAALLPSTVSVASGFVDQCEPEPNNDRPCPDLVARWSNPDNRSAAGLDSLTQLLVTGEETAIGVGWTAKEDGRDWAIVGFDLDEGGVRWSTTYGSPGGDGLVRDAVLTPDGELLIVVGVLGFDGPDFDHPFEGKAVAAAFDPDDGSLVWLKDLDLGGPGVSFSVAISPHGPDPDDPEDGPIAFISSTMRVPAPNYETDVVVTALRLGDQQVLWQVEHDDPAHAGNPQGPDRNDYARDVVLSPEFDRVYVAAESDGPQPGGGAAARIDFLALAFDADTGDLDWRSRYDGPIGNSDHVEAAGVSDDGDTLVLTGWLQGHTKDTSGTNFDFGTVALSTSDGETLWSRTYSGGANEGQNVAFDLLVDGERVYVAGPASSSRSFADVDYTVVTYRLTDGEDVLPPVQHDGGDRLWDVATTLAISPGGDLLYVSGYSQTVPSGLRAGISTRVAWVGPLAVEPNAHARTIAVDTSTGALVWAGEFNSANPPVDHARVWAATLTPDGETLLLGGTFGRGFDETWDGPILIGSGNDFSDIGLLGYRLNQADAAG